MFTMNIPDYHLILKIAAKIKPEIRMQEIFVL